MLNNLFYAKSINKFNKISFYITFILTLFFLLVALYNTYVDFKEDIIKLEKDYFNVQKEFVKNETTRALSFIEYKYKKDITTKPLKQLQNEIIDAIEQMRNKTDGTGYIFIYDFNGINIADPILKKNAGKNLINFTDPNGKKVIKELIDISKQKGGGYVQYVWNKPISNTLEAKISYANSFQPWQWMIGSGVYLDEINKVLTKRKSQYKQQVVTYVVQILLIALFLFLTATLIYKYFITLIQKDINLIIFNLQKINNINTDQLTFKEFRNISKNINRMTNELKDLNLNLEQKVSKRTIELKQSEQFAHKLVKDQDKFIKNAIHEINTPLSIIITNIDLFRLSYKNNKYITKVEAGSKIIHNIYNDLSYMLKKDRITYTKENINLSSFLKTRIEFFDEVANGNNVIFNHTIEENIYINFNATQLQRMFDNLISNAIKYSYENHQIMITLNSNEKTILFTIQNSSDTIQDINKLFQRYYRENKSRGGFGIGLNIIKDICTQNNIELIVCSKNNITSFSYLFLKDSL
jgi:signal transduction histidine kinase